MAGAEGHTVQVLGTFGGATVTMQGSNDGGVTWFTLKDLAGSGLAFTSAGGGYTPECPERIRPLLSGGAGSDLDVYMVSRHR